MDTRSNRKNDTPHTTYRTPHTVSVTIQQPRNVTGPRLGPRTLDRTSTGINSRSTGGHQHVGQKSSGYLKTLVHFVCFWIYDHPLILCPFLPTLCGPELVRCAHITITSLYLSCPPVSIHVLPPTSSSRAQAVLLVRYTGSPVRFTDTGLAFERCKPAILSRLNPIPPYPRLQCYDVRLRYPACT